MKHTAAFMSEKQDWETPQAFFDHWNERFGFTLDAAASSHNAKCERYFTEEDDALSQDWDGVVWLNPPYSHGIGVWIRKAWEAYHQGATVVLLIPARTDTAWWHDYVMDASEIWLVRGRLRFVGTAEKSHNAPFPSAVIVFDPNDYRDFPAFHTMDRVLDEEQAA